MSTRGDCAPTAQRRGAGWCAARIPAQIVSGSPMVGAAPTAFRNPQHRSADWAKTDAPSRTGRQRTVSNEGASVTDLPLGHGADPSIADFAGAAPSALAATRNCRQLPVETVVQVGAEFAVRDALDRNSSYSSEMASGSVRNFRAFRTASESARGVRIRTTGRIRRKQANFVVDWTLCSGFQEFLTRALLSNCERSVSKSLVASEAPPAYGGCQRRRGSHGVSLGFDSPKRRVPADLETQPSDTDGAVQAALHGRHGSAKKKGRHS